MDKNALQIQRSVYTLGAYDGLWVGLAMGFCVMVMVASSRYPSLSLLGLVMFLAIPFMAWAYLRRAWVSGWVPATFSAVWLHGICIFLFGSIITALMMYISLRFVVPGWIESQTMLAVERLSADPETAEQARILSEVVKSGQMPSPIYTSVSSIWLVAFTGSMWSLLFAFILTHTPRFVKMRATNIEKLIHDGLR